VQAIVLLEDSVAVTPVGSISKVALVGENQLVVSPPKRLGPVLA
jgi:hypothetical protein